MLTLSFYHSHKKFQSMLLQTTTKTKMPSPKPAHPLPPPPPQRGTWYPYSSSFESTMAMVLIILFCTLLCALILKLSFYCITRRSSSSSNTTTRQPQLESDDDDNTQKPNDTAPHSTLPPSPPTLLFYSGLKLAGAEVVCAICLSEFVDGEGIRVLPRCGHGFHVTCIQSWLSSHTSCPTCRTSSYVIDHEKKKQNTTTTATGGEETELARLDLEAQSRLPLPLTSQLPFL